MQFTNEKSIEDFIIYVIGGTAQVELTSNDIIDVMTNDCAIEVKKELTPEMIDKAGGQLLRYGPYVGARKRVIAGITPHDFGQSVLNRIDSLGRAGIEVWLIDQMPMFKDRWEEYAQNQNIPMQSIPSNIATLPLPQPINFPTVYQPISQQMMPMQAGYGMGYPVNYPDPTYLQQAGELQRAQRLYGNDHNTNFAPVDLMNRDVDGDGKPDPIQYYRTDDVSVFHWVIGGFFSLFFLVSMVGLYVAYNQGRMPIRWQSVLFQREFQLEQKR